MPEINATASAVKAAEHYGVKIQDVTGTGKNGRVTGDDIEAYAKSLEKKADKNSPDVEGAPETPEAPKEKEKPITGKFLCTGNIKDDGIRYAAGDEYKGKNAKNLLDSGAIKRV